MVQTPEDMKKSLQGGGECRGLFVTGGRLQHDLL